MSGGKALVLVSFRCVSQGVYVLGSMADKCVVDECKVCKLGVSENDAGVECEGCKIWVHAGCVLISKALYAAMGKFGEKRGRKYGVSCTGSARSAM